MSAGGLCFGQVDEFPSYFFGLRLAGLDFVRHILHFPFSARLTLGSQYKASVHRASEAKRGMPEVTVICSRASSASSGKRRERIAVMSHNDPNVYKSAETPQVYQPVASLLSPQALASKSAGSKKPSPMSKYFWSMQKLAKKSILRCKAHL